jgi:hypothetical protein
VPSGQLLSGGEGVADNVSGVVLLQCDAAREACAVRRGLLLHGPGGSPGRVRGRGLLPAGELIVGPVSGGVVLPYVDNESDVSFRVLLSRGVNDGD